MKRKILDRAQPVGYDPNEKKLIVTLSEKMAKRMQRDGWVVHEVEGMPPFVLLENTSEEAPA